MNKLSSRPSAAIILEQQMNSRIKPLAKKQPVDATDEYCLYTMELPQDRICQVPVCVLFCLWLFLLLKEQQRKKESAVILQILGINFLKNVATKHSSCSTYCKISNAYGHEWCLKLEATRYWYKENLKL